MSTREDKKNIQDRKHESQLGKTHIIATTVEPRPYRHLLNENISLTY